MKKAQPSKPADPAQAACDNSTPTRREATPSQGRWIRPVQGHPTRVGAAQKSSASLRLGIPGDDLPVAGDLPLSATSSGARVRSASRTDVRGEGADSGLGSVAGAFVDETRSRLAELTQLERELEDRIRQRWTVAEAEVTRLGATARKELEAAGERNEAECSDLRTRAEQEGRADGFREGFARGREEGHQLGLEEGRREGVQAGREAGLLEAQRKLDADLAGSAAVLTQACAKFDSAHRSLLEETRGQLVHLAVAIASKLVKRELEPVGEVALRNIEKAVDLIFRRGTLVIQVHPDDEALVAIALDGEPRWAEGFEVIEVKACVDVDAGGCRLVSGAGTVDMTLATQVELIEESLGVKPRSGAKQTPPTVTASSSSPGKRRRRVRSKSDDSDADKEADG